MRGRLTSVGGPASLPVAGSCLLVLLVGAMPLFAQGQPPPAAPAPPRPNVVQRPWTTTPGSPYDRAQAVAAERVWQGAPSIDFPVVEAPPAESPAAPNAAAQATASAAAPVSRRPNVLQRPWTAASADSPYRRAQDVAAERVNGGGTVAGASPYPDEYRSPVPAPFQPQPSRPRWRPVLLYPALPFRPITIR